MERASCPFHFRTDYPNPGHEAKNQRLSAPNTPYALFPVPYSLLPTPYSLLPTPYSLLPTFKKKSPQLGGSASKLC
ncbi:hypothetical protein [Moorena sp. SIO1F2]|uniref:hypothetical protein n=1 Tax=Moorena sp. SIO1F2 TaxID=2607819 RepID=UPI0025F10F1F|nr:hypothetical protein [Moorena sp. SIO1F2]